MTENKFIPANFIQIKEAMELLGVKNRNTWNKITKECQFIIVKHQIRVYYDKNDILYKYQEYMKNKFKVGE